jgi:CBS domain-containing protein
MLVKDTIIHTKVVKTGMLVRDVFEECGRTRVQALPFVDGAGRITGRVTLKNIMKFACLPEHMVAMAPLLGSFLSCVDNAEEKVKEVICSPVDKYVREVSQFITSEEPTIKALALMERSDTSYIFVVDDGEYKGIVTIQGIAAKMSEMAVCLVPTD